jgi:hypothetical protein
MLWMYGRLMRLASTLVPADMSTMASVAIVYEGANAIV